MSDVISMLTEIANYAKQGFFLVVPIMIIANVLAWFSGSERAKHWTLFICIGFICFIFFFSYIVPKMQAVAQ